MKGFRKNRLEIIIAVIPAPTDTHHTTTMTALCTDYTLRP